MATLNIILEFLKKQISLSGHAWRHVQNPPQERKIARANITINRAIVQAKQEPRYHDVCTTATLVAIPFVFITLLYPILSYTNLGTHVQFQKIKSIFARADKDKHANCRSCTNSFPARAGLE